MQSDLKLSQNQKQDEAFIQWLSPSHYLVEAQLLLTRKQRTKDTLRWIANMDEFQDWRTSSNKDGTRAQVLWIKGVAKSTIAGYLVDFLKTFLSQDAIVAYFFCRRGHTGLTNARDIIRTLSYQCSENSKVRSTLETLYCC